MIEGVNVKKLRVIPDERGFLMEMLRADDPFFQKFGQAYLTAAYPGVVKGWHYHKIQTDHFIVVKGMMKVVLYDMRENSSTKGEINEFFMGELNPMLITIPPGVLHGMKCISEEIAFLINIPTEIYEYGDPDEHRVAAHDNDIPYDWGRKDG
jgi:dTDP-4-dehydrorhamnose 3,5-epimerase